MSPLGVVAFVAAFLALAVLGAVVMLYERPHVEPPRPHKRSDFAYLPPVARNCAACGEPILRHPAMVDPDCDACQDKRMARQQEADRDAWAERGFPRDPPRGAA